MANKKNFKKKNFKKGNDKKDREDVRTTDRVPEEDQVKGPNDISWRTRNKTAVNNAANVVFQAMTGSPLRVLNHALADCPAGAPGIQVFLTMPTVGEAGDRTDAVNIAASVLYQKLRRNISGQRSYDAPDLMEYLFKMDNAMCFGAELVRLVGLINYVSPNNRYTCQAIIKALGYDFDNLVTHQTQLRSVVTNYASRINQYTVPKTIPLFERHYWLFSNIWKDEDTNKAQLYAYVPRCIWVANETESTIAPGLHTEPWYNVGWNSSTQSLSGLKTVADIYNMTNKLLRGIVSSEDVSTISGDLGKVYGDNRFVIPGVSETFYTVPTYAYETLVEIENMTICPEITDEVIRARTISHGEDNVLHTDLVNMQAAPNATRAVFDTSVVGPTLLNIHGNAINPDLIMLATSSTCFCSGRSDGHFDVNAFASEVVFGSRIYFYAKGTNGYILDYVNVYSHYGVASTLTEGSRMPAFLAAYESFMHHPIYYLHATTESEVEVTTPVSALLMNMDNVGEVPLGDLQNIQDAAILSLYNITEDNSGL